MTRGAMAPPRAAAARTAVDRDDRDPGVAGARRPRPTTSSTASTSSSSAVRRDPANPLAALKTTSRADYVFARLEARRAGADDALFLTIDGHLSEATTANVFLVRGADGAGARDPLARLRDPARDDALLAARVGRGGGLRPSRAG